MNKAATIIPIMPKASQLTPTKRGTIIGMKKKGASNREIAEELDIAPSTVFKIHTMHRTTGSVYPLPRSGRPAIFDERLKRRSERDIEKYPGKIWADFGEEYGCDATTIRKVAAEMGYHKRVMRSRPFLTARHIRNRKQWAKDNINTDWKAVLFTDESSIELGETVGQPYTIRKANQQDDPKHIVYTYRNTRDTLMVWGGIAHGIKFPLKRVPLIKAHTVAGLRIKAEGLNAEKYIREIVEGPMADYARQLSAKIGGEARVLEDSAPCHTAKVTKKKKEDLGIVNQVHPASSPDLNPIEPMWYELKRKISSMRPKATNLDMLWAQVEVAWDRISQSRIEREIDAMEERRVRIVRRKGLHTGS